MKLRDVLQDIENRNSLEELTKKRFACSHCRNTWVELVGFVIGRKDGKEDLCLRIGMESEACGTCRMKARECQECGSKDVYEIKFAKEASEEFPLNFRSIKSVSRG